MSFDFNIDEILKMAEQIEKNGANFYNDAAEGVADSPNRALLRELAQMEDQHENIFATMRAGLSDSDKEQATHDPENETESYLKMLAGMHVFAKKDIDVTDINKILKSAMAAEKDTIVFFLHLKELVPDRLGKDKIDAVIKEEMEHMKLLGTKMAELKKGGRGQGFA